MDAATLAYVFWHAPLPSVELAEYERGLGAFHASLAGAPPKGFRGSASYRASRAPWEGSGLGAAVYVDWYVVEGWAALGELEDAAVAPAHRPAHDGIARFADRAYGGLYRLRRGAVDLPAVRFDGWVGKPRGVPSEAFADGLLLPGSPPGTSVWQRQLALGPAPEFCRRSVHAPPALVDGERRVEVRPVAVPPRG